MPSAGDLVRASDIIVRKGVRLRRVANQSINSGSATPMSWDTEDEDEGGFWTSGTTVTIPTGLDGLYGIVANVAGAFSEGGGARDFIDIVLTAAATGIPDNLRIASEGAAEDLMMVSACPIPLEAGDSFVVNVFHQTGAGVNFTGWLSCYRIGL
jgi:hypothetical protein